MAGDLALPTLLSTVGYPGIRSHDDLSSPDGNIVFAKIYILDCRIAALFYSHISVGIVIGNFDE